MEPAAPEGLGSTLRVFVILDERTSLEHPLGDAVETFLQREDAERFIEDVRGDDPELASYLRIEEPFDTNDSGVKARVVRGHASSKT
jgi:hypothetical protein